jgi:hypothetical protein
MERAGRAMPMKPLDELVHEYFQFGEGESTQTSL